MLTATHSISFLIYSTYFKLNIFHIILFYFFSLCLVLFIQSLVNTFEYKLFHLMLGVREKIRDYKHKQNCNACLQGG